MHHFPHITLFVPLDVSGVPVFCCATKQTKPKTFPSLKNIKTYLFKLDFFFFLAFFFLATSYTAYLGLALGGPPIMISLHCRMNTDATMLSSSQVRSYSSKSCVGTDLETVVAVFIFPSLRLSESQFLPLVCSQFLPNVNSLCLFCRLFFVLMLAGIVWFHWRLKILTVLRPLVGLHLFSQ